MKVVNIVMEIIIINHLKTDNKNVIFVNYELKSKLLLRFCQIKNYFHFFLCKHFNVYTSQVNM